MTEDEIHGRHDFAPPSTPRGTTLPPEAKTVREVMHGIRDIAIPAMCLLSMKLGFEHGGYLFAAVVLYIIGANAGARKPEGLPDVQAIMAAMTRR